MSNPKKASPSMLIGNAVVSLTPPRASPGAAGVAAANADEAPAAPPPLAVDTPRRRARLSLSLRLAVMLWALGAALLAMLTLLSRLPA
ncbi:hypothetical protein [Achromobacter xylosoxidans]|uniref:hypothetical protein n=1 Tax=Alcaligenes xylosoxydans xylosoxydans TaxID=85698 RepID=UPI0034D3E436